MELSFVLAALRRRFWLVLLFALLGAIPGLLADDQVISDDYQSFAELEIRQPTQGTNIFLQSDPDRYVQGQLAVLESAALVTKVAQANGLTPLDVREAVTIEQEPETDVVGIQAIWPDPDIARQIAQGYVDDYMATLDTNQSNDAEVTRLDGEITTLTNRLTTLNTAIKAAMEPYLASSQRGTNPRPVPPIESVVPAEVSEKTRAESELLQLQQQKNQLRSESILRVNTRVIQNATLPTEPVPAGAQFLLAGGLFGGAMLGIVAALTWARFSTKVLDEDTASEILGAPVVSEFPHYRSLARSPLAAFQALPRSAVPVIDQLCVRAEAKAKVNEPLSVVVVGTQRGAGATTLALAMAERFASGGSSVVLVDADVRDPRVTAIFNAAGDGGVPSVVSNEGALIDQRGRSVFTRTMDPEVSVLGLGANRGAASLRRDTVAVVLEAARRKAQIVVIDGGPALDLASTLQFAALADAIVIGLPLARQKSDGLSDLSRQLGGVRDKLLPVVTAPTRRSARGNAVGVDGVIAMPGLTEPPAMVGAEKPRNGAEPPPMAFGTSSSSRNPAAAAPPSGPPPAPPAGVQPVATPPATNQPPSSPGGTPPAT